MWKSWRCKWRCRISLICDCCTDSGHPMWQGFMEQSSTLILQWLGQQYLPPLPELANVFPDTNLGRGAVASILSSFPSTANQGSGVSAHRQDQEFPKKCGHTPNRKARCGRGVCAAGLGLWIGKPAAAGVFLQLL